MGDRVTNPDRHRVTVQEAARQLGVSEQAIRKRVKRGTLEHDKEPDGRVYVYLDEVTNPSATPDSTPLISQMQARIESLERQLEEANAANQEHRRIIIALTSRIPQIEAPQEPQEKAESAGSRSDRVETPPEPEKATERPWWRRLFGR